MRVSWRRGLGRLAPNGWTWSSARPGSRCESAVVVFNLFLAMANLGAGVWYWRVDGDPHLPVPVRIAIAMLWIVFVVFQVHRSVIAVSYWLWFHRCMRVLAEPLEIPLYVTEPVIGQFPVDMPVHWRLGRHRNRPR